MSTCKKYIFLISIIISLVFIGCRESYNEFSPVAQKFQDSVNGELTLCFYPSTIRMLNLNNDTTFNKIFKDIKKIKVVRYNRSADTTKNIIASEWAEKLRKDKYIDLLRFKQGKQDILVFLHKHNDEPKKFFGIVSDSSQVLLIDLVGTIPMQYISEIATGNFDLGGFNTVVNFSKPSQQHKKRNK